MAAVGMLVAAVALVAAVVGVVVGADEGADAFGAVQQQVPSKRFSMNYLDLVSPTGAAKAASSASTSSRRSAGTKRFSMNFLDTMRDEADPRSWQRMGTKHTAAQRSAAAALQTKRTLLAWSNADRSDLSSDDSDDHEDEDDHEEEERHEAKAKAKAALSARFLIETVNWLLLDAAREGGVESVCASPVMRKLVGIRRNLVLRHGHDGAKGNNLGIVFDC